MNRVSASNSCAAVGVLLLALANVAPADWYPQVQFLGGIALLAVSHVLTPCRDLANAMVERSPVQIDGVPAFAGTTAFA